MTPPTAPFAPQRVPIHPRGLVHIFAIGFVAIALGLMAGNEWSTPAILSILLPIGLAALVLAEAIHRRAWLERLPSGEILWQDLRLTDWYRPLRRLPPGSIAAVEIGRAYGFRPLPCALGLRFTDGHRERLSPLNTTAGVNVMSWQGERLATLLGVPFEKAADPIPNPPLMPFGF